MVDTGIFSWTSESVDLLVVLKGNLKDRASHKGSSPGEDECLLEILHQSFLADFAYFLDK